MILIALLSFGIACAPHQTKTNVSVNIDSAFNSQVQLFEDLYNIPVNVSVRFVPDLGPYAAVCHVYSANDPNNWIEVEESYWYAISDAGRDQLLLHEFGHCVLGLDHREARGSVGGYFDVPLSIMYPVAFGDNPYYRENLQYYYEEFIK